MTVETRARARRGACLVLFLVCAALPGLLLLALVASYGVDISYSDEWTFTPMLVKVHEGTLRLADLFALQNEHRYLLPKLLFIGVAFVGGGNVRLEMFSSVLLCAGTSLNVWWLFRRTLSFSTGTTLFLLTICNVLLFSPVQAQNWTWGISSVHFLINFLLTSAIVAAQSGHSIRWKFGICVALAFLASFSFGSGFVLWFVTFPPILLGIRDLSRAQRSRWLAAWVIAAVANAGLYSLHYAKPAHHPPIAASRSAAAYFRYVMNFLGGGLYRPLESDRHSSVAMWIGFALLLLYLGAIAVAALSRDGSVRRRLIPWLALGGSTLVNGGMAALTRIGFGPEQALESRYTTYSLLLPISLVAIFAILSARLRELPQLNERVLRRVTRAEGALLALLAVATLNTWIWGIKTMAESEQSRRWGKATLLFGNVLDVARIYENPLGGWGPGVLKLANMQNALGLLHPPLFNSGDIASLSSTSSTKTLLGRIDTVSCTNDACEVSGWAVLPKRRRVADSVVIAYQSTGGTPTAIAVTEQTENRPEIARWAHNPAVKRAGWKARFSRASAPAGELTISAWAVDSTTGHLYELRNRENLL